VPFQLLLMVAPSRPVKFQESIAIVAVTMALVLGVTNTRFNDVYTLLIDNQDNDRLILADYNNYRMRDVILSTGDVSDFLGSGTGKNGFNGDTLSPHFTNLLDFPTGLIFDDSRRSLYIVDQNNHVLREVNPYGQMQSVVGQGDVAGDPTTDNDVPSTARMRTGYNTNDALNTGFDLTPDGSLLQLNSDGHNVRVWNRSGSDAVYFNQFIQNNRITTVAGDWTTTGTVDGPALSAQMNHPNSVKVYDNGGNLEMFIADTRNHCIRRVDPYRNHDNSSWTVRNIRRPR
jgi:hypothetical protein